MFVILPNTAEDIDMEKRLKKRLHYIQEHLFTHQTAVLNRWDMAAKDYKSCCNFFNNPNASLMEIITQLSQACASHCPKGEHVLVLQDTTEVNYNHHNGRLRINDPDLGVLSNNLSTGLMLHAALAIGAGFALPFGLPYVEVNNRPFVRAARSKKEREAQPLEEKESYRWLQTLQESRRCLSTASQVTVIGDRESDIYELFAARPDQATHLLVRSNVDRLTNHGENLTAQRLSQCLNKQPWQGKELIILAGNQHRHERQAQLQCRWCQVSLPAPAKRKALRKDYADPYAEQVELWVVEVVECAESVPQGEAPIHWRLLTTHCVEEVGMAWQVIYWYSLRWLIEELFRILKQVLKVEESQFETGIALKKLLVLALQTAWKTLLMKQEREGQHHQPASACFSEQEIILLKALQPGLEESTIKQQNPHSKESLAWAAWLIARLGGWKPAPLDKRPFGVISLGRGMQVFKQQCQGWQLAQLMQNPDTFPT